MTFKSIVLAAATVVSLAAPAAAKADPYWGHEGGYREGWRDGEDRREHEWREHEWREHGQWQRHEWRGHEAWEHGGYGGRCFVERRGYYNWYGQYVSRPVRVCR